MPRARSILACAVLAVLLLATPAYTLTEKLELAEKVHFSRDIVIGQVNSLISYWEDGRIYTDVTVEVQESLKGRLGAYYDVTFKVPGGTVSEMTMVMSEAPKFQQGEQVLLFLKNEDCRLVGWFQGKYVVEENLAVPSAPSCSGVMDYDQAVPLDLLKSDIRNLVLAEEQGLDGR